MNRRVALLAGGIGLLVAVLVYANAIYNPFFPLWELFKPASLEFEGDAEWRMLWFSVGVGALVALVVAIVAVRRDRTQPARR